MSVARMIRQTMTIARRDFIATVYTPTFLLFLFAPLMFLAFGALGGLGAATVAGSSEKQERIVYIGEGADADRIRAADVRQRRIFNEAIAPPTLVVEAPAGDPAAQARGLFDREEIDVTAVLYGNPAEARVVYVSAPLYARYLSSLADQATRDAALGDAARPQSRVTMQRLQREGSSIAGRGQAAFFTVMGLFVLTLMLAGQAVGTLAEERSNKVIEVLAAAVPLESVFLGKLIGMFGVALLFLAFWGTIAINFTTMLPADFSRAFANVGPAIGMMPFALLFLGYFTMAYLLLGAVFLGIGAQASTPREIQMLSLPITIFQMAMLGLASLAAAQPGSTGALIAEVFPFSSPFAMAAKAANEATLWPHFAALAWQALWVAITVAIGARLFRRGVLQSAGPKFRWSSLLRRSSDAVSSAQP